MKNNNNKKIIIIIIIDVHMFFFPFLCSGIPDLALGILKMLLPVCFCDVLQLTDY